MNKVPQITVALSDYLNSWQRLVDLGVLTNKKDFTSQIGEWLISAIYNGERAQSGIQKDWDVLVQERKIQVKTHSKAPNTTPRWTGIKSDPNAKLDELVIIVFSPDYKLIELYKVSWNIALPLIKKEKHRDVIYWKDLLAHRVNLDELPNQSIVNIFR